MRVPRPLIAVAFLLSLAVPAQAVASSYIVQAEKAFMLVSSDSEQTTCTATAGDTTLAVDVGADADGQGACSVFFMFAYGPSTQGGHPNEASLVNATSELDGRAGNLTVQLVPSDAQKAPVDTLTLFYCVVQGGEDVVSVYATATLQAGAVPRIELPSLQFPAHSDGCFIFIVACYTQASQRILTVDRFDLTIQASGQTGNQPPPSDSPSTCSAGAFPNPSQPSPTPTQPPASTSTVPSQPPSYVHVERTVVAPAGGSATINLQDQASVRFRAGSFGASIDFVGTVATDPGRLDTPRSPVADSGFAGRRYLQFQADVEGGAVPSVTLAINLRTLELPRNFDDPAGLRIYYWNGAQWVNLGVGRTTGQGEPDLHVLERTIDLENGILTLTVDHLSSYAIGVHEPPAAGAGIPAPPWTMALLSLAALALAARRTYDA